MTVKLAASGRIETRSRVIQVAWRYNKSIFGTPSFVSLICGSAIIFDLGARGQLVAALEPDFSNRGESAGVDAISLRAFSTLPKQPYRGEAPDAAFKEFSRFRGRVELPPELRPQLIWVKQPANSRSAVEIAPSELPTSIGADVTLVGVSLETTNAPIDYRIAPPPPWLVAMREHRQGDQFGGFNFFYSNIERNDC